MQLGHRRCVLTDGNGRIVRQRAAAGNTLRSRSSTRARYIQRSVCRRGRRGPLRSRYRWCGRRHFPFGRGRSRAGIGKCKRQKALRRTRPARLPRIGRKPKQHQEQQMQHDADRQKHEATMSIVGPRDGCQCRLCQTGGTVFLGVAAISTDHVRKTRGDNPLSLLQMNVRLGRRHGLRRTARPVPVAMCVRKCRCTTRYRLSVWDCVSDDNPSAGGRHRRFADRCERAGDVRSG